MENDFREIVLERIEELRQFRNTRPFPDSSIYSYFNGYDAAVDEEISWLEKFLEAEKQER